MARRGVKKFTSWQFKHDNVTIDVPVSVVDGRKTHDNPEGKTYFSVRMSEPEVDEQDTDINRLRETVFARLRESLKIEWTSMLHVSVTRSRGRLFDKKKKPDTPDTARSADATLVLKWERVQITTFNGKKMQRAFNSYFDGQRLGRKEPGQEHWTGSSDGWPEVGREEPRGVYSDPTMYALIPDTPENRVALEAIGDGIEKLYTGLERLLSGDRIEQTLAQVAATGLLGLPAPKPQKTKTVKAVT